MKKKNWKDERKSDGIIFPSNTKLLNSQDIYHNEIFEYIHWYHTDKNCSPISFMVIILETFLKSPKYVRWDFTYTEHEIQV